MLLVEMTINGTMRRLSRRGVALEHWWANRVVSMDTIRREAAKVYGGQCRVTYGSISLSPEVFVEEWPPPASCPLVAKYTDSDEAAATTLFSGTAHIAGIDRESVTYDLYGESYDTVLASGTALDDTLANVMSWACDASRLNLSLDVSAARSPSPAVVYTALADRVLVDALSDICAFFSHLYYIEAGTLYLVDMLADNGSRSITEFDFFPSQYEYPTVVSGASAGDWSRPTAYPYGDEISLAACHDTQANVEAALDDILSIYGMPGCGLELPMQGNLPVPGERISWTDTALVKDTLAWIRARALRFDFDDEVVVVEGEGGLAAA